MSNGTGNVLRRGLDDPSVLKCWISDILYVSDNLADLSPVWGGKVLSQKIRVLHVLRQATGGMRQHVLTLLKKIDSSTFDLMVACPWNTIVDRELVSMRKRIFYLDFSPQTNLIQDTKCVLQLIEIIKDNDVQVVHTHGTRAGLLGRTAALFSGTPITISTVHNFVYRSQTPWWQKLACRLAEKGLSRSTSRYIAVSRALAEEITKVEGIPKHKVDVVYNGVDLENFNVILDCNEKKRCLGLEENATIIGTAGRLIPSKGVSYFIEAAALVKDLYPDTQFLIVGDGPERGALERLTACKGLSDCIRFAGFRRDLLGILPLMSIFVVPSLSEGQSIVTLEAMAARRPVVAFKTGGIPELINHNRSGILVPKTDHRLLAEAIINLLENPKLAERIGNNARNVVEQKFQQYQMVQKTEEIYRQCLAEKGFVPKPAFST